MERYFMGKMGKLQIFSTIQTTNRLFSSIREKEPEKHDVSSRSSMDPHESENCGDAEIACHPGGSLVDSIDGKSFAYLTTIENCVDVIKTCEHLDVNMVDQRGVGNVEEGVEMRLDEQQCEDQPVDNVKESVQMMDDPLVEDQIVHGSYVDVQTEEMTHVNEKIVVQGGEYRKVDGDGTEEPKRDKIGECIRVEGSVYSVDVDVVDQEILS
ncbi:Hypothetical predicted protein [Olea europaea subsp. europaea]|uniref:Uncharacterized protein n=1 Tax=Olea europaea subsp. europaea TaxID=158383 RepID=A0A8S0TAH3_OLEEU|nr:Hypothetical predicted protein [Olea europaea subsp. europaea]